MFAAAAVAVVVIIIGVGVGIVAVDFLSNAHCVSFLEARGPICPGGVAVLSVEKYLSVWWSCGELWWWCLSLWKLWLL